MNDISGKDYSVIRNIVTADTIMFLDTVVTLDKVLNDDGLKMGTVLELEKLKHKILNYIRNDRTTSESKE